MTGFVRHPAKRSQARTMLRLASALFYTALLLTIAWTAADRWNDVPADASMVSQPGWPPAPPIDPKLDRTEALMDALNLIPPLPAISLPPPPEGKQWVQATYNLDIADALNGPWTPETRPNQRTVVEFLESEPVRNALNQIAGIPRGAVRLTGFRSFSPARDAAKLLIARARYHHEARDDFDAAVNDLGALIRLSSLLYDSGSTLGPHVGMACEGLAHYELRLMVRQRPLAPTEHRAVVDMLVRDTLGDDRMWSTYVAGKIGIFRRELDMAYSDSPTGDGRLVLSHLGYPTTLSRPEAVRSGAWNLLSVLFNSRRTVTEKLERFRRNLTLDENMSYWEASERVSAVDRHTEFNFLDGPLVSLSFYRMDAGVYEAVTRCIAMRRASHTTIALSAFYRVEGRYPESIDELVPEYADNVPVDPFSGEPFRYRREDPCDYRLYSVGRNGLDEDGLRRTRNEGGRIRLTFDDSRFRHDRGDPHSEPELEAIPQ